MENKVRKIVCGGGHTGLITVDGDIYLMGRGSDGQLGRGNVVESIAAYRPYPTLVEYFKENNISVENLALGSNHTLVVTSPRV
jgi:alpha-tubulin suppressor-like RCC1 family protein